VAAGANLLARQFDVHGDIDSVTDSLPWLAQAATGVSARVAAFRVFENDVIARAPETVRSL